jgi:Zn-finger nucleic acid-binding protein
MAALSRVCPHCGATAVPRSQQDHATPVICAGCGARTEFENLGGLTIDACRSCGGTWFDDGELESVAHELSDSELARDAIAAIKSRRPPQELDSRQSGRYFSCPVCGEAMMRRNYGEVSGIILHRCSGHGTWLDRSNELRFLQILADGRLPDIERRGREAALERARRGRAEADAAREESAHQHRQAQLAEAGSKPLRSNWSILDILDFFS